MLGTNQQRRRAEALESIARSSARVANSVEQIAAAEREKTGFLRWLFSWWREDGRRANQSKTRRYGDGGGLSDREPARPIPPPSPNGGLGALPAERACIDVTPPKLPEKKGRLW